MSLNINRQATQKNIVIEQNRTQKQHNVKTQDQTAATSSKDSVQFTQQALNLNKMQSTAEPQVNKQRIESLKAAILNGDYKINTERLAEKLNQFEGDFNKAFV